MSPTEDRPGTGAPPPGGDAPGATAPGGGRGGGPGPLRILTRIGRGVGIALGSLLLLAALALVAFTQTDAGRGQVRAWVEGAIQGALADGRVEVGRIVAGNLLTRAVVERFVIRGPDGDVFVEMDSVRLEYDPLGFLGERFVFRNAEAARAHLRLVKEGDGVWNFDRIFGGEDEPGAKRGETRILVRDLQVHSGHIEIRQPFAADLEGVAREEAIRAAVRGETIWRVERNEEGVYQQVYELESVRGRFPLARIVHPRDPMTITIAEMAAVLKAVTQPLDLLEFQGELVFRDTIWVEIGTARLAASRLGGGGWVVPGDPPQFRFEMDAEPAGFADLQWLPVPVPEEGGGPMQLVVRSRGEVTVVEAREAEVEVRDSEMRGDFTLALEETPRFDTLHLHLEPLRVELLNRLLDRPELIDGYLAGVVDGSGPIDLLHVDGAVVLQDLARREEASRLEARGRIGIVEPFRMRDLHLGFDRFEPRWARILGFDVDIGGRLAGTATLDGNPEDRLGFEADLAHSAPDIPDSHLVGEGSIELREPYGLQVSLRADPLALAVLDPYVQDVNLVGTVRGPLTARGSLSDLRAEADLQTPRGRLTFDGLFDLVADPKTYDAEVVARDIDLSQWMERAPESRLAVRGRIGGKGTDPATLEARFDLEILPSEFAEARVDTSLLRFTVHEGLATVDTFAVRTDVGRVGGRGGFGLVAEKSGSLTLDIEVPDLSAWNRWVVAGRQGPGPSGRPEDIFQGFLEPPGVEAEETEAEPPDTLAGALTAQGVLYGNVEEYSVGGRLEAGRVSYGGFGLDSLSARLDLTDPTTLDSLVVNAAARKLTGLGFPVDSLGLRVARAGPGPSAVEVAAATGDTFRLALDGGLEWTEERKSIALDALRLTIGRHDLALADSALVSYAEEGLVVRDLVLRGEEGVLVRASGEIPKDGAADFRLEAAGLRIGELLRPYPGAPELGGIVGASLAVGGTAAAPVMNGSVTVERPTVGGIAYSALEGTFRYADRRVGFETELRDAGAVLVRAEGAVAADLAFEEVERRIPEDAFDFRLAADSLPLTLVELMAANLRNVRGHLVGEVDVSGGPSTLRADGEARIVGGAASVPNLGVRFVDVGGQLRFRGSEARLDSVGIASSAGGSGRLSGTIGLAEIRDPTFDLELLVRRMRVMDRRSMSFEVNADASLEGSYRDPLLTGAVRVFNGDVRQEDLLRQRQVIDLTDPDVYALIDTTLVAERRLLEEARNPFMQNLRVDVDLTVGPDLWFRSEVLDVELAGEGVEVRMDRAEQQLVMFGTVRLVRGTYVFSRLGYRQTLRITGGTIEFVGTPGLNPNLQIEAEYRARTAQGDVVVRVTLSGTMQDTELALASDPPMSESDQLCFLAVGSPCLQAVDQRFASRAFREAFLGTLSQSLSGAFVGDLGLDLFTLRTTAAQDYDGDGFFGEGLAGTQVEIGKYVGNELFITVAQPLGNRAPEWSIEWRFTEDWTLEVRAENRFARSFGLASFASSLELDQTYGLFIFREWSF